MVNIENTGKKVYVENMFNNIAQRYDFLNHFLSLNIDYLWRKKVIALLKPYQPKHILDVASGTADLAIQAISLNPVQITGIDISDEMLKVGQKKIIHKKLDSIIQLMHADAENIPFENDIFDAAMVAFGVRNFENLKLGITEMHRVIRPGGVIAILEFSKPSAFPVKQIYKFYFKNILPFIGNTISKSKDAYIYLPDSVSKFPDGDKFSLLLSEVGFKDIKIHKLTFGIASIYFAVK
ncbi:MAG: bifunctional demethylmenaquinone methyltransferase/2-methoxy-6-polyprenyl-1,4-benzoquinol methylase UbiE [Bacteroidetes bacterium]|nr:bifunctional demethylmenaquinone methyltransferase/2-methoxy-6-polyprenyl-1,4-benzoquinol methylase UbiE [Bacteroidota bacterium]